MDIKKLILSLRKPGKTLNVLEIGVGMGETLRDLQGIEGVKLHGTNLKYVPEFKGIDADIKICHLGQLTEKFADTPIDLVFANHVMFHSTNFKSDLEQISKIMASGGRLVFNEPIREKGAIVRILRGLGFKVFKTKEVKVEIQDKNGKTTIKNSTRFYAEKI